MKLNLESLIKKIDLENKVNKTKWFKTSISVNDNFKISNKNFIGETKSGENQKLNPSKIFNQKN